MLQEKNSGSAKVYSQSLADAATRLQGKKVTTDNAMQLIAALMGSGQQTQTPSTTESPIGGLAGSLLTGMMSGQMQDQSTSPRQDPLGGLAGSLLSGLMGGETASQPANQQSQNPDGFDANDLLQAGMAFFQAKQQGSSPTEAMINTLLQTSPLGNSSHRKESGALIINTILQVIRGMTKK
jgi:hypothetical protein